MKLASPRPEIVAATSRQTPTYYFTLVSSGRGHSILHRLMGAAPVVSLQ